MSAARGRVEWSELRNAGGRVTGSLYVRRISGGRTRRRVVLRQSERFWQPPLGVALTTRGELAWLANRRVYAQGRVIARGTVTALRLEDDRTLPWWDWRRETWRFHDLRPWPGGGCPVDPASTSWPRAPRWWARRAITGTSGSPSA